jgi:hypothetical protein
MRPRLLVGMKYLRRVCRNDLSFHMKTRSRHSRANRSEQSPHRRILPTRSRRREPFFISMLFIMARDVKDGFC